MRKLMLAFVAFALCTLGSAHAQSHTYVIHNGSASPGTTTYTPASSDNDSSSGDAAPTYPRAQPGQHYQQIYYGDEAYLSAYRRVIRMYNASISARDLDVVVRSILYYSWVFKIDPRFVVAVVAHESRFQPQAVSPVGAQGLGQLMPETAASMGVNPHVPYQNIQGTVRYLKLQLDRFANYDRNNQKRLALASYNAGYGAVAKYGGVPPYAETQRYVEVVMAEWRRLSGER